MLVANVEQVEMSVADVAEHLDFTRGLLCACAMSVPLWSAIIALAQLVN